MNLRDPWFGLVRITHISKLLASYWSYIYAREMLCPSSLLQTFPKTQGFCIKRSFLEKNSLFSIKTTFEFLEKTQISNVAFQGNSDLLDNNKKFENTDFWMISKISCFPENQDQDDMKDIPMVCKVFGRAMIMMLPILQGYIKSLFEE